MQRKIRTYSVALALGFASGCGPRTILVPESSPIRVGPGVVGRVYVREAGEWTLSANEVEIPEGTFIVPPSYVEE
jgi:hypothetical protein